MPRDIPHWIDPVMRAGYAARAAVYVILGGLACAAALGGGSAEGTRGALATLRGAPFGTALLWIVAAGLACYGLWRLIAAWQDLENRGGDESGVAARLALVVTGVVHLALGASVAGMALGGSSGGGSGASGWTAQMMALPFGKWIAAAVGLGIAGAGVYYVWKGWARKYRRYIRTSPTTRRLDPAMRGGFVAYGVVIALVGAFVLVAGLQSDPSEAKGIGAALNWVRSMAFGRILLGVLALGLLGFAVENAVEAGYRVIPGRSGGETLADRVRRKGREAVS